MLTLKQEERPIINLRNKMISDCIDQKRMIIDNRCNSVR